jgi:hypothetical protein
MIDVTTVGDPEAMRAIARDLRRRADALQSSTEGVCGGFAAVVFEGPAAPSTRMAVEEARGRVLSATQAMSALAAQLASDADRVEEQNAELRRRAEEAARQAAAEEAAAKAQHELPHTAEAGQPGVPGSAPTAPGGEPA